MSVFFVVLRVVLICNRDVCVCFMCFAQDQWYVGVDCRIRAFVSDLK